MISILKVIAAVVIFALMVMVGWQILVFFAILIFALLAYVLRAMFYVFMIVLALGAVSALVVAVFKR